MKNIFFGFILVLAIIPTIYAQQRQLTLENSDSQKRVALVIGNASYASVPLKNPVNDANDIAQALREAGFEVIYKENLSQSDMKRAIREFGAKLKTSGGVGLFYFAGHGVQVKGTNYLVPVDATVESEEEIEYEAIDAGFVLAQMEAAQNSMNIVILDACRNNPFARSFRSVERGLAQMDASSGTLIAYATAPGSVASDGNARNGVYTQELLKFIKTPNLSVEEVFKQVRISVLNLTQRKQTPWESSSLVGNFYFSKDNKFNANSGGIQIFETPKLPRIEKVSGDQMIIPIGEWKSFAVRALDSQGKPIAGAKVAWQTLEYGGYTYVGATDQDGISTATNMYTSNKAGTFTQVATMITRDTPVGFTEADKVIPIGNRVTFTFKQQ